MLQENEIVRRASIDEVSIGSHIIAFKYIMYEFFREAKAFNVTKLGAEMCHKG
jgi:hypothetical protein